jgi:starch synthase/alpha-amylase
VNICDFDEKLSHTAYAAADFLFMPSRFEPCGLPQMIGPIYGTLPIAHDTGGIHDTVNQLDVSRNKGNGFLFEVHDSKGLRWATDQAMNFFRLPTEKRDAQIARIMRESKETFNQEVTADRYVAIYRRLLEMSRKPESGS